MSPICKATLAVLLLTFSFALIQNTHAQDKIPARKVSETSARYVKEDLPYIACITCKRIVAEVFRIAEVMRGNAPYKALTETHIQPLLNGICIPEYKYGYWARQTDIVHSKVGSETVLEFEVPGGMSKCGEECETLVKSCEQLLDDEIDRDELSALLFKNKLTAQDLEEKLCVKESKRCKGKPKYVPARYKRKDYPFVPMDGKAQQMDEMMSKMNAEGLGGGMKMYNRDDMAKMTGDMDEEDEYGEEPRDVEVDASGTTIKTNKITL